MNASLLGYYTKRFFSGHAAFWIGFVVLLCCEAMLATLRFVGPLQMIAMTVTYYYGWTRGKRDGDLRWLR